MWLVANQSVIFCMFHGVHCTLTVLNLFLGKSHDRSVTALSSMGTAIANGGITTFLALILLGFSQSHAFIVFFKVK